MSGCHRAYLGRAGQLAVMAELAERGWNVAVPEVDLGDDILLLDDVTGAIRRIQVKTARARPSPCGFAAKFKFGLEQLLARREPDLLYVLVVRHAERWARFVILTRRALAEQHARHGVGHVCDHGRGVLVTLSFVAEGAAASTIGRPGGGSPQRDFTRYVSAWSPHLRRLVHS